MMINSKKQKNLTEDLFSDNHTMYSDEEEEDEEEEEEAEEGFAEVDNIHINMIF